MAQAQEEQNHAGKGTLHEPFLLLPAGKDYLWGGRRLRDDFSKEIDLDPLAETWECSTHPDGPSTVASGPFQGRALAELVAAHPEILGSHPRSIGLPAGQIPILVKFIDASRDLSIQVHPDDAYAKSHENGSLGKTEMWYVVDAAPGASLIYGFNRDMSRDLVRRALLERSSGTDRGDNDGQRGTIEKYLQKVPVHKGDVFYIAAGTVHAICAGSLVVEVQENSNLTYRMYDYHRVDKNGRERELKIDQALDVMKYKASSSPRQPMHVLRYRPGFASEFLCRCRYFEVEHLLLNTERIRSMAGIRSGSTSFEVLVCIDGCGTLFWPESGLRSQADVPGTEEPEKDSLEEERGHHLEFFKGDTIFLPADSVPCHIHGRAEFLRVIC